jgi:hypothetical protein
MAVDGITASTTERVVSTPVTLTATSTRSCTPATESSISTAAVCPTSSANPLRFAEAKPAAETVRSTIDGGRLATTKLPSLAVGTVRDRPVARLLTTTVADGTALPCASRTSPRSVAVVCPYARDTWSTAIAVHTAARHTRSMHFSIGRLTSFAGKGRSLRSP